MFSNLQSATDFCMQCGSLVELPEVADYIDCNRCGYRCSLLEYEQKVIVTVIKIDDKKPWIDQYFQSIDQEHPNNVKVEETMQQTRATIKHDCPKCANDNMYFWTAQLRSADEGSTVFYECTVCAHRIQQNN